jgi:hypothetical protein
MYSPCTVRSPLPYGLGESYRQIQSVATNQAVPSKTSAIAPDASAS